MKQSLIKYTKIASKRLTKIVESLFFVASVVVMIAPLKTSLATTLNINDLGEYHFSFEKVSQVNKISGSNLLAKVSEKKGENYSVSLPFSAQQVRYIVANGDLVEKDQPIAILIGYDVHHFLDEFAAAKQLFANAEQQYNSSKPLFKSKALKQSKWIEISKNFYAAQLRFEHLHHLKSFLYIDKNENISIITPTAGTLRYASETVNKKEGAVLFDVVPESSMRLQISAPLNNVNNLASIIVKNNGCELAISSKENIVMNYNVTLWTVAVTQECRLILGQNVVITPVYQQSAFVVSKSAIFEFENQNYIAVKKQQQLELVAIEIVGADNTQYIFTSEVDLNEQQVLASSVSVVQGVLLNLGGE